MEIEVHKDTCDLFEVSRQVRFSFMLPKTLL